jgi:hypothetical protein
MLALGSVSYHSQQVSRRCLNGPCVLVAQENTQTLLRPCIQPE